MTARELTSAELGECYKKALAELGMPKGLPDLVPVRVVLQIAAETSRQVNIMFCHVNDIRYPGLQ